MNMMNTNEILDNTRKELLDIGLRGNTLINFRSRTNSIEIIDEKSKNVYSILVESQIKMSFLPLPEQLTDDESIDEDDILPSLELLEDKYGDSRFTDTKLQTKLNSDKLDKTLLKISNEAKTSIQETGVDTLYLVLGFMEWYEDNHSELSRKAPLVLIPVTMERNSAKKRFTISYSQTELGTNLSLAAKLKSDFGLLLPNIEDEFILNEYFSAIETLISTKNRWQVHRDEIALGFFSFGKFLMYADLDPDNWPDGKKPGNHPIIKTLIGEGGFSKGEIDIINSEEIDLLRSFNPTQQHFVLDADSSQTEAIIAVNKGSNLVIQGPPGTGKSQTITNIISEALAQNKKILFVSEKMAALEVVKKRLDDCELGVAVLELHSHKTKKKLILEELKHTLEIGEPKVSEHLIEKERHQEIQKYLDTYCEVVNQTIRNSGISFINALGKHIHYQHLTETHDLPSIPFTPFKDLTNKEFTEIVRSINELEDFIEKSGKPSDNPFFGSKAEHFYPSTSKEVVQDIEETLKQFSVLQKEVNDLIKIIEVPKPESLFEIEQLELLFSFIQESPRLSKINIACTEWITNTNDIANLLATGEKITTIINENSEGLRKNSWEEDIFPLKRSLEIWEKKWWRFLSSEYRATKKQIKSLLAIPSRISLSRAKKILMEISTYQGFIKEYELVKDYGQLLFDSEWKELDSNWKNLLELQEWTTLFHKQINDGIFPKEAIHTLQKGIPDTKLITDKFSEISKLRKFIITSWRNIYSKLEYPVQFLDLRGKDIKKPISAVTQHLQSLIENIEKMYDLVRFNHLSKKCIDIGSYQLIELATHWDKSPGLISAVLKNCWYEGLVYDAYEKHEELQFFDRVYHESLIKEFKHLDSNLFNYAKESIVQKLFENLPVFNAVGEMGILQHEINKKRRHLPIRQLLQKAGKAIQAIKPVFMMGPMSVAKYLQQGSIEFDLVIFDEASQMRVVEAFGAILRAKQVVVVGDTKQMPPSDFFNRSLELDDEEALLSQTADIESILGMFLSKGSPQKMLKWHYRSRHDSLIAVSNKEFYDNKLVVFPSPGVNPKAKGLKFNHVQESFYDRGGSRSNKLEAKAVANAIMSHAKTTPELSLGVVAFSVSQRDCIMFELEKIRRVDDSCEGFFTKNGLEDFFIKNLENVQGDERDVIFISIGYGRSEAGKLSRSFGPLNREGGERRLNVLITRSRLAMEVFCNFTAEDLDTTGKTPFGVKALKSFLYYAENRTFEQHYESGNEPDSPFENEVILAIQHMGYQVEPQVGSAGFYIDIAVRDIDKPGRFILAVECDGATYHSSLTARDRDRIRQNVLENLGWRFHRIWSTDWFRTPNREIERLKKAILDAQEYYKDLDMRSTNKKGIDVREHKIVIERSDKKKRSNNNIEKYETYSGKLGLSYHLSIPEQNSNNLVEAIRKIVEVEAPIHKDMLARRITSIMGYSRVGNKISDTISYAISRGHNQKTFYKSRNFIYKDSTRPVVVRDRTNLETCERKFDYISDEEIQAALIQTINGAFSISIKDAISEALSLMGFQRSTSKIFQRMEKIITVMVKNNILNNQDGLISIIQKDAI